MYLEINFAPGVALFAYVYDYLKVASAWSMWNIIL